MGDTSSTQGNTQVVTIKIHSHNSQAYTDIHMYFNIFTIIEKSLFKPLLFFGTAYPKFRDHIDKEQ